MKMKTEDKDYVNVPIRGEMRTELEVEEPERDDHAGDKSIRFSPRGSVPDR